MRYFIRQIQSIFYSKSFKKYAIIIIGIIIFIMAIFSAWKNFGKGSIESVSSEFIKLEILKSYGYDEENYEEIDTKLSSEDRLALDSIINTYTKNGSYIENMLSLMDKGGNILDSISSQDIDKIKAIYSKYTVNP